MVADATARRFFRPSHDLGPDRDLHRDREHGRDRHFHEPRISGRRFAERLRHHGALGAGRGVRALRRALLRGAGRGFATLRRRVSFFARDLSPGARLRRGLDFGDGWLCRAGRDRGGSIRSLSRRSAAGIESTPFVVRRGLARDAYFALGFSARERLSKHLDSAQDCFDSRHHRGRFCCREDAARFLSGRCTRIGR